MSNREFTATRTMLLMAMAESGRAALEFDPRAAAALAAIPNTDPPRYVVAGTLAMIGKVLPKEGAPAAATVLTDERIDELAKPFAGMGGVEDYRTFARAIESEVLAHAGDNRPLKNGYQDE